VPEFDEIPENIETIMHGGRLPQAIKGMVKRCDIRWQRHCLGLHVAYALSFDFLEGGRARAMNGRGKQQSVSLLHHVPGLMQNGTRMQLERRSLFPNMSLYFARQPAKRSPVAVTHQVLGQIFGSRLVPVSEMAVVDDAIANAAEIEMDQAGAANVVSKERRGTCVASRRRMRGRAMTEGDQSIR